MKPVPVQCQAVTVGANGVEHICALTTTHRYRLKSSNPNCNYQIHLCQWHGNDWKKEGWLCMDKNSPSPEEVKAKMDLNERNQVSEAILFLHSTADGKLFNEESQDKLRLAARILGCYPYRHQEKRNETRTEN